MQKLIIAIVSNEDSTAASRALTKGGFSVTRLATTGGPFNFCSPAIPPCW